jgi:hypothetical protein
MSFTNYLEHATLDYYFGGTTYTPSGTLYVGLSTTTPLEDGTNFTQPGATGGYARVAVTNNKTNWSTATQSSTSGTVHNKVAVAFPQATQGWGIVTHVGIFDNSGTGANMLVMNALTQSKTVDSGDTLTFPSGGIVINID